MLHVDPPDDLSVPPCFISSSAQHVRQYHIAAQGHRVTGTGSTHAYAPHRVSPPLLQAGDAVMQTIQGDAHYITLHHEQQLAPVLRLPFAPGHHVTTLCNVTLPTLERLGPDSAAALANVAASCSTLRLSSVDAAGGGEAAAAAPAAPAGCAVPAAAPPGWPEGSLQEGAVAQPYWGEGAWQDGVAAVSRECLVVPSTLYSVDRAGAAQATHLLSFMQVHTEALLGRSEMRCGLDSAVCAADVWVRLAAAHL